MADLVVELYGRRVGTLRGEDWRTFDSRTTAVGNLDMHGKNLSILHAEGEPSKFAPVYDMVPLAHRTDLDGRMSLATNGVYPHRELRRDDLVSEGASWGLSDSAAIVDESLRRIDDALKSETPDPRARAGLLEDISGFTTELMAGRSAGRPRSAGG